MFVFRSVKMYVVTFQHLLKVSTSKILRPCCRFVAFDVDLRSLEFSRTLLSHGGSIYGATVLHRKFFRKHVDVLQKIAVRVVMVRNVRHIHDIHLVKVGDAFGKRLAT